MNYKNRLYEAVILQTYSYIQNHSYIRKDKNFFG